MARTETIAQKGEGVRWRLESKTSPLKMTESTTRIGSSCRALGLLISISLLSKCCGFGLIPTRYNSSPGNNLCTNTSPLFVAQSPEDVESDPKKYSVIKSLDAKMEKFKKDRDKYQVKLNQYEQEINELKTKKMRYLEGIELGQNKANVGFSETAIRSAVKAMMWRVIAGSVTFMTSLKFSGSFSTALRIVGSDFFSKALTMFIGERLMNKSQAGRNKGADSTGRSVAKALIWRLFAISNTLVVSYFFAKDLKMASKIAGSDAIFKTSLMVAYERVWANIEWGKEYDVGFSI